MMNMMSTLGAGLVRGRRAALAAIVVVVAAASTASAIYIEGEQPHDIDERDLQDATSKTFLVTFNDNSIAASKRCDALAKSHGGSVTHVYNTVLNGCSINVPNVGAQVSAQATFTALSNNPAVKNVEASQRVYAFTPPLSSLFAVEDGNGGGVGSSSVSAAAASTASTSWGLDRIDQCTLPLNNLMTKQDATGVTVFIIDTGVRNDHVQLASSMSTDDCHVSMISGEAAFSDGNGHGTHVAGTTCGATYGVSANCKLCAVKVLSNAGSGTNDGVIAGIDYVANICSSTPGMKCVANMSLGGGYSPSLNQAVANAVNKGVVMVVAAGNESQDACFVSPASEPLAITVGSTTSTDDQSSFSNWGSCVDVYAPGSGITSSWSTSTTATNTISGTSMASPHVAGIAAAIRSANPSWTATQVRDAIVNNAILLPFGRTMATIDDIAGCPPMTVSPTPAPTPCPMGTVNVEVKLKTDSYPLEARWTLTNKCGSGTVINGPAYSSPNYMHSNMYCLPNGSYDFRITDSWGDGICCTYGMGSYEVIMGGVSAVTGGAFLSEETKTFGSCALAPTQPPTTATPTALPTPPPTPCPNGGVNVEVKLKTDNWYMETSWTLTNKCGSGNVINSPAYTSSNTMFVHQYCVPVGSYDFRITDSYGDGICCAWGQGSYEVIMGGVSAATGGEFTREETKTFGACAELPVTTEPSSSQATSNPSHHPTPIPTEPPTSSAPTNQPTSEPTSNPTSSAPTSQPTSNPTSSAPTSQPTSNPTSSVPTSQPTSNPTSSAPTSPPTSNPTSLSSTSPPTSNPTSRSPTRPPTSNPTSLPPVNAGPPTLKPTLRPTTRKPTRKPVTRTPTRTPTRLPTRAPTQPPGSICIGGTFIEIRILTDTYPTETAWTLTNLCGTGTSLSSPFYTAKSTEHSTINCLPNGLYNFTITDSANDGLCCAYGIGNYSVVVNGTVAYTGSNFGAKETQMIGACV